MDDSLISSIGVFSVDENFDENTSFIFAANEANIALDNIKIEDLTDSPGRKLLSYSEILFSALGGTMLIVDSVLDDELDAGYNGDSCTVIVNDRLTNDSAMIYRLIINCTAFDIDDDFTVNYTMDSAVTDYVDHFSAIQIGIYPETTTYYPGESITFNYSITDRLGNVIDDETIQNTTITLSSGSFVGLLAIDEDGDCLLCEEVKW